MSEIAQGPEKISSYKLSDRTLVVVRERILVAIEKQLISLGFDDTLRISKRPLEKESYDKTMTMMRY